MAAVLPIPIPPYTRRKRPIDNFGVRIEDDVLITETGGTSLTRFPKDLMVLKC